MLMEGWWAHLYPGGLAFDLSGYRATFELSAAVLVAAAMLACLASRAASRAPRMTSIPTV